MDQSKGKNAAEEKMEHELAEQLEHGPMKDGINQANRAKEQLSPKYEVRIRTEHDPIVEETARYREIAQEVDNRYDDYVNRAAASKRGKEG